MIVSRQIHPARTGCHIQGWKNIPNKNPSDPKALNSHNIFVEVCFFSKFSVGFKSWNSWKLTWLQDSTLEADPTGALHSWRGSLWCSLLWPLQGAPLRTRRFEPTKTDNLGEKLVKGSIEWKYQQIAKSYQIFQKQLKTLSLVVSRVCFGFNHLAFWNLQQSTPNKIQKKIKNEPQIPSVRNKKMQLSLLHHLISPFFEVWPPEIKSCKRGSS